MNKLNKLIKTLAPTGRQLAALALLASSALASGYAQAQATGQPAAQCPALLQHEFSRLQDEKPQSLCQYSAKVLLVVNTASFCGFTSQYKGLESLYARYKDKGLVVLGFPSNDFSQESGSNKDIAAFCESTFGVKFPMFTKSSVTGKSANPFFQQLATLSGTPPRWNFHKYVVARDGKTVVSFLPTTGPQSASVVQEIEKLLNSP